MGIGKGRRPEVGGGIQLKGNFVKKETWHFLAYS